MFRLIRKVRIALGKVGEGDEKARIDNKASLLKILANKDILLLK